MYLPSHFTETDLAALDTLVARDPFATLVTVDADGPFASHLPVLYRRRDQTVEFSGHWARANPQWRHDGEALLIVHGPHTYLSPGWYPDKEVASRVPTWNYAVAHCSGQLERIDDEAGLGDIVDALSRRHEAEIGSDWRFEPGRDGHRRLLRGIVGFRLRPTRIELKFKLNQNHPAANVESAAAALEARGGENPAAIATLMRAARRRTAQTETG